MHQLVWNCRGKPFVLQFNEYECCTEKNEINAKYCIKLMWNHILLLFFALSINNNNSYNKNNINNKREIHIIMGSLNKMQIYDFLHLLTLFIILNVNISSGKCWNSDSRKQIATYTQPSNLRYMNRIKWNINI